MQSAIIHLACLGLLSTALHGQDLTNSTDIEPTFSWWQQPGGWTYPVDVRVPDGPPPPGGFPVCILLHGNGGNGFDMLQGFGNLITCHALVAPTGYANSWNICAEQSDAPDTAMIDALVTTLQTYDQVLSLTTSSCESIPYVRCDADGNVIELLLNGRGLTGVLDWTQISALPQLKNLRLGGNKLEGAVLSNVFASSSLEQVSLNKNRFTGTIPCPTSTEPRLTAVDLSNNLFTGALPDCLFNQLPRLRDLDVSYNLLTTGSIPPSIQNAQQLVTFRATEAGLSGAIPSDLKCARKLITLAARGNSLSGTIPQLVIDGLPMLNTLDLSYNYLTGGIPNFPAGSSELRNLYLNNNQLTGRIPDISTLTQLTKL